MGILYIPKDLCYSVVKQLELRLIMDWIGFMCGKDEAVCQKISIFEVKGDQGTFVFMSGSVCLFNDRITR